MNRVARWCGPVSLVFSLTLAVASSASASVAEWLEGTWQGAMICRGTTLSGKVAIGPTKKFKARFATDVYGAVAAEFSENPTDPPAGATIHADGLCGRAVDGYSLLNGPDPRTTSSLVLGTLGQPEQVYDVDLPVFSALFKDIRVTFDGGGVLVVGQKMGGVGIPHFSLGMVGACKLRLMRVDSTRPTLAPELISACGVLPPSP